LGRSATGKKKRECRRNRIILVSKMHALDVPKIPFGWIALLILLMLIRDRIHVKAPVAIFASLNSQVRLKTTGYSSCDIHACV
jgi:hypothetical protein